MGWFHIDKQIVELKYGLLTVNNKFINTKLRYNIFVCLSTVLSKIIFSNKLAISNYKANK